MRIPLSSRIAAVAALAILGASHARAGERLEARYCPAVIVDCAPGLRYSDVTCGCVADPERGFRPYRKLGAELSDAVASGDPGAVGTLLAARFDGVAAAGGVSAAAAAVYADMGASRAASPARHVEPGDVRPSDEIRRSVPPAPRPEKPKPWEMGSGSARADIRLVGSRGGDDGWDNAATGAAIWGAAGAATGGVAGAVAGAAAGAASGAISDLKEGINDNERRYREGTEQFNRTRRER